MRMDQFGELVMMLFPGKDGEVKAKAQPECPVTRLKTIMIICLYYFYSGMFGILQSW